jgi:YfiH family protein
MNVIKSTLLSSFPYITACFTTRQGGVSKAPYNESNLAFHVGDNPSHVLANHDLLARKIGYDRQSLIHMRQIHSNRIIVINDTLNFDTPPECDALITNRLNIPLMVMSADCTPILLYDPIHHVISAVHAGRAGALNEIVPKTIIAMGLGFGSIPSNIHAVLGPSISGCCYEINSTIAEETRIKGYPEALRFENQKIFLDVNTILKIQLKHLRVEKVEVIDECTACHHDRYFSYRADHQQTGRIAGVIILR